MSLANSESITCPADHTMKIKNAGNFWKVVKIWPCVVYVFSYPLMNMPLPGNVPSQHQERLTDYRVPSEESQEAPLPQSGKNRHPSDLLKPPWVIQTC